MHPLASFLHPRSWIFDTCRSIRKTKRPPGFGWALKLGVNLCRSSVQGRSAPAAATAAAESATTKAAAESSAFVAISAMESVIAAVSITGIDRPAAV